MGCSLLREKIAEYEGVKEEEIVCGNGAAEVIFTLCRAVNPKRALIPAPTFAEYGQALASMGCELEYYMLTENDGFVLGDSYLDILHKGLDIAFLCNPNNPTGMLIPHRLLKKILEKCRKLEILLVVDECFLDFVKEPQEYYPEGIYKTVCYGRCTSWIWPLFQQKTSGKNGTVRSALERFHHGTGSRNPGT